MNRVFAPSIDYTVKAAISRGNLRRSFSPAILPSLRNIFAENEVAFWCESLLGNLVQHLVVLGHARGSAGSLGIRLPPERKDTDSVGFCSSSWVLPWCRAESRIAVTRAVNRALRKAYGIGLCSIEERSRARRDLLGFRFVERFFGLGTDRSWLKADHTGGFSLYFPFNRIELI